MFNKFIFSDPDREKIWYILIDDEFESEIYPITLSEYNNYNAEIIGLNWGRQVFSVFLEAIYNEYKIRNKNPTPNILKFMNYYYNHSKTSEQSRQFILNFLKSKNINFDKYMVLL